MKTFGFELFVIICLLIGIKASTWNLIENGPHSCGKVKVAIGTSYGGVQTTHGAYPWNAALIHSKSKELFCGGSLISNDLVLTAAHCIEGKHKQHIYTRSDILVVLGAHKLSDRYEVEATTESVKEIYLHHEWNPYSPAYDADIAILELRRKVTLSEYIQPICIAVPNSEAASKLKGIIVGFGKSEHTDYNKPENIARKIPSPIHSYEFCVNSTDHNDLVTHRTFCGGYANGTSVCVGDSGSGLIVEHNGLYYLRGIVSSSISDPTIGCNISSYSILTDVLEFHSWITTGKDEKTLTQDLIEENRRCKVENLELLEKIAELEMHTTTTEIPNVSEELTCYDSKGLVRDCRISDFKCKEYEGLTQKFSFTGLSRRKTLTNKCQHKAVPLIVNGVKARRFEFPHHAILGNEDIRTGEIKWPCSGSLISSNFILTAAQCSINEYLGKVKLAKIGMNNVLQSDERVHIYGIEEVFRHPNHKPSSYINDIALLKLNETVTFSEYLYPICLPTRENEDQKAVFTGFGSTGNGEESSNDLLKITLDKYSNSETRDLFEGFWKDGFEDLVLFFGNHTGAAGPCKGDGGGPLQVANDDFAKCTYTIIGINTFGPSNCNLIAVPNGYTNIYKYLEWIEEVVWNEKKQIPLEKNDYNDFKPNSLANKELIWN